MGSTTITEVGQHPQPQHGHLVTIKVDGNDMPIHAGEYRVSHLKTLIKVPAEYELDLVVHGDPRRRRQ